MDFDPVHQLQQQQQQQHQSQEHSSPGAELAPQACASCRKQKRRCDKTLPQCSLCQRIGRPCDYRPDPQLLAPSPEDFAALRQQVSDLEQLLRNGVGASITPAATNGQNSSNGSLALSNANSPASNANLLSSGGQPLWPAPTSFPSLYFLDSNAFMYEKYQIQAPHVRVPPGALAALGNSQDLRAMIEHYFATIHTYFPIVSKIRLYQHLANPLHEPGSDMALLFLAMKLSCSEISEGMPPQTQLYQDVKSFHNFVESQNGYSIQLMQALLLIALFEMGHAIYPAAYLSIGHAARVGHAAGIHAREVPQILPRPNTWTEQEERRRVWWGVIILDRFINLGHRGKPFATGDPGLETHLPTDDQSWDRGQMLVAAPLSLSASETIRAAPFARTCQSAHLMGKALRHIDDKSIPCEFRFQDALQLSRTMRALTDVVGGEHDEQDAGAEAPLCTSMAVCFSSLLTLYDAYTCTERAMEKAGEDQLVMQKESIDGLREYSGRVVHLARRIKDVVERHGTAGLSPMVIDSIYQGAANFAWYVRESSDPACGETLAELKEVLLLLDRRWRVAGEYLFFINDFASREVHF